MDSVFQAFELAGYEPSALATKRGGLKTGVVLFITGLRAREYTCESYALRPVSAPGGRYVTEEEYQKLSAAFPVNEEAVTPVTEPAALARRMAKAEELLGIKDAVAPVLDERARKPTRRVARTRRSEEVARAVFSDARRLTHIDYAEGWHSRRSVPS